ncbi:VOC family protein [Granulosicoccus sp. 3-233]|uniref:VOC family protein n=1 Tax=Granulosicoccus sp. 3-233 TaxID=3417969 RepID=UPI003D328BC5
MDRITTFLWFDGQAEAAADFYTGLFPDSRIDEVTRSTIDYPGGSVGDVIVVSFTLSGRGFQAMNGGPGHPFTEAISLSVDCADQAEVDHYWDSLIDGGEAIQCGWLKDRYGLCWQVVPRLLPALLADPDREKARRVMEAMVSMIKLDVAALEQAAAG